MMQGRMISVLGLAMGKPLAINPQVMQALAAMPAPDLNEHTQRLDALRALREPGALTKRGMLEDRRKSRLQQLEERRHDSMSVGGDGEDDAAMFVQVGNVAVINIWGVLRQYESEVCYYGYRFGTSYEGILCALQRANESQGVTTIVLAIDCPGGSAVGLVKVCEAIASSEKPVIAVNRGMCCSAATALSVRCSRIVVEADAIGANIGTYTVLWDYSEAFADAGIIVDVVKSGEHKGTGEFGAPISESQRAEVQRNVDSLANLFKAQVAVGRRLSAAAVNELADGRCMIGQEIIDNGLADEIGTLDSVLGDLQQSDVHGGGVATTRDRARNARGQKPATRSHTMRRNAMGMLLAAGTAGAAGFVSGMAGGGGTPLNAGGVVGAPGIPRPRATNRRGTNSPAAAAPKATGLTDEPAPEEDPEDDGTQNAGGDGAGDAENGSEGEGAGESNENAGGGTAARTARNKPAARARQRTPQSARTDDLDSIVDARVNARIAQNEQRLNEIQEAAASFQDIAGVADLCAKARGDATISVEQFRSELLEVVAKGRTPVGANSFGSLGVVAGGVTARGGQPSDSFVRDAALWMALQQVHGASDILAAGGPRAEKLAGKLGYVANGPVSASQMATRAAAQFENSGLASLAISDIAAQCVRRAGIPMPHSHRSQQMFRAAHSTSDFPMILQNIASKALHMMGAIEVVTWDQWCSVGTATDYKEAKIISLSEAQNLVKVPEGGKAKRVTFNERQAGIVVETYAALFGMTYQMFRNDDLSAFTQVPNALGQANERLPEDIVYALLQSNSFVGPTMSDGSAYFHTKHRNILSTAALSNDSLQLAYTAMRTQKGFGKDEAKKSFTPDFVLVPPQLEFTARQLLVSPVIPSTGSTPINVPNLLAGTARVIVADRLTSSTRWYLGARPNQAKAIEVRFLDGQRGVQIDRIQDGNPLEITMQATNFGVGAAMVDPEALQTNPGA